jgi:hypothetical protein
MRFRSYLPVSFHGLLSLVAFGFLVAGGVRAEAVVPLPHLSMHEPAGLPDQLGCLSHSSYEDDVYFYDRMTGITCFFEDDSALLVQVYEHESSVHQVLERWLHVIDSTNQIVLGGNWFAIGPEGRLMQLATVLGLGEVHPLSSVIPDPVALTERQEFIGMCSGFVVIAIRDAVFNPDRYAEDIIYYEQIYPGFSEIVMGIVAELKRDITLTEDNSDARASHFGALTKSFCGKVAPR